MRLAGQRIVITRPVRQSQSLAESLSAHGAELLFLPTVEIAPPEDPGPLRAALRSLIKFSWIVFTSSNAVSAVSEAMGNQAIPDSLQAAAIGQATADAARRSGFRIVVQPEIATAEALCEALTPLMEAGSRVLLPSSELGREVILDCLQAAGASVRRVTAYRNRIPDDAAIKAATIFQPPLPDWIVFASPSALQHLLSLVSPSLLQQTRIASIGPTTTAAINAAGLQVTCEAMPHTNEGLVKVIVETTKAK